MSNNAANGRRATRMGALVHLIGFLAGPFGAGLVVRFSTDEFTEENAQNALNWQLLISGAFIVAIATTLVLINVGVDVFVAYVGLLLGVVLANFVSCLVAAYKARRGEAWEYPFKQRFV